MNPMDLKRGIDLAAAAVVKDIERRAKKVQTSEEIGQVGNAISGPTATRQSVEMIADAMKKVGQRGRDHGRRGEDRCDRTLRGGRRHAVRSRAGLSRPISSLTPRR